MEGRSPFAGGLGVPPDMISTPFLARKGDRGMPKAPHLAGVERFFITLLATTASPIYRLVVQR